MRLWPRSAPDERRSAPVDIEAEPVQTDAAPLLFGCVRTPKEHAAALLEHLRRGGAEGRTFYAGHLEEIYQQMCAELGWDRRSWLVIGRELRVVGLRKAKVPLGGSRLTVYTIATDEPRLTVVK